MKLARLNAVRCLVGESPVWDEAEQALFLVDIAGSKLHRLDPQADTAVSWDTPGMVTAMALGKPGEILIAMADTIHAFNLETGATRPVAVAEAQPANATINDGRVDRQGRFVVGSCCTDFAAPSPVGGIYALENERCRKLAGDITFSNGACFSPDGSTLYFADSAHNAVFAYTYDTATGDVGERRLLTDTLALGGLPDGATVDASGNLWVTINQGGKVAAFHPDGTLSRIVELPTSRPGSVAFGGPNLDRLFVTTIDLAYFGEGQDGQGGYVFAIDGLGTRGLPEPRYRG